MIKFLPEWARPNHRILQYELAHLKYTESRRTRFLQVLSIAFILGICGYLYASNIYVSPTKGNITDLVWRTVYFPTLLVQVVTSIIALSLGVRSVGQERDNRTWDNLRATEAGAELTLRTRWVAILYRLRAPILAILLVRFVLIIGILYDMTAYGGLYVEMLTTNLMPPIPDWRLAFIVLALIMTATMILPITMIASFAGIGLLISVIVKNRTYSNTLLVTLIFAQLFIVMGLLIALSQFLAGRIPLADLPLFGIAMAYSAVGDWGLLFMQLGSVGEIWAIVPFAIVISFGLFIVMLGQSMITDALLWLAVKLSESRE